MQMEDWNIVVVDINPTCTELGPKCLQLMDMHVLSEYNTVFCPFNKGKISALDNLQECNFLGLYQVLGEEDATRSALWKRNNDSSQSCMFSH